MWLKIRANGGILWWRQWTSKGRLLGVHLLTIRCITIRNNTSVLTSELPNCFCSCATCSTCHTLRANRSQNVNDASCAYGWNRAAECSNMLKQPYWVCVEGLSREGWAFHIWNQHLLEPYVMNIRGLFMRWDVLRIDNQSITACSNYLKNSSKVRKKIISIIQRIHCTSRDGICILTRIRINTVELTSPSNSCT